MNIRFIGSEKELSQSYNKKVVEVCRKSWNNTGLHLNVAMNYGGRREIIEAFQKIIRDENPTSSQLTAISIEMLAKILYVIARELDVVLNKETDNENL